jgi:hypothetical protein
MSLNRLQTTNPAAGHGPGADPRRGSAGRALVAAGRRILAPAALAALAALPGCTVYQQARRTMIHEPTEFSWKHDRQRSLKIYRQWADQAWIAENGPCPEEGLYNDYALGFRDGFVDFVYAGGDGEPPPVPPRKFWNVAWRTPEGNEASHQWFNGYRHGAHVARTGGYRERGIVATTGAVEASYWAGDEPQLALPAGEDVGAPGELLPVPPRSESTSDALNHGDDSSPTLEAPEPPAPPIPREPIPSEPAPADAARPELDDALPAEPFPPHPAPADPFAPAPAAVEPANQPATSARERFRRAAVAVHITPPSSAP